VTFWALGEIVKSELGILESDTPDVAATKLDGKLPEGPDREWLRQRLLPLVGLEASSPAEREELFTAWRRFLEGLALEGPSVFVFEDLHWADDAMLAFLEHVADWAEGAPMLLVATARPELFERHPTWAASARNGTRINLGPLSQVETAELISLLLQQSVLPADVQALILERSGGNPLYAEEFIRLLRDRGLLAGRELITGLADTAEIPFPESIHALIAARLDTLPPDRKALLHDAAVIGKVFWAGAVAAMTDTDRRSVVEALHGLSRKELVRPARLSSVADETEYAFWHILVRDVAYAQIPRRARIEKHRRAAAWIQRTAGDRVEDDAEILAYHYTTALDLARISGGGDVADLEEGAFRFLLLAGAHAIGLDTEKAIANLSRALEFAPPDHPERAEALVRWADATPPGGRHSEAAPALDEAIALFRERGEPVAAAQAMVTLSNVLWQLGDARGREMSASAVALLEEFPPGPELIAALAEVAAEQHLAGEYRESIASAERAIELADQLGLAEPAKPLEYAGASRLTLGDAEGLEAMRRAAALAVDAGQTRDAAIFMNNLADATSSVDGPAKGLALYRAGIEFADRRGMSESSTWMAAEAAAQSVRAGALDESLSAAEHAAQAFESTGRMNGLARANAVTAVVLAYRGRAGEALPVIDRAVEAAAGGTAIESVILAHEVGALVHLAVDDPQGAVRLLERLAEDRRATDASTYTFFLPDAVRAAVRAGDIALGERMTDGLLDALTDQRHALSACRAILAEARGDHVEASHLYATAAGGWEQFGALTERAFALLGEGRCLVALGETRLAEPVLRNARDLFSTMGMGPALAETEALLGSTAALAS
jgi:tetratricopeptide (TPR) repeat protein